MPDGLYLIDKPAGVTSHDIVARVRRGLGGRKGPRVGHAGTLDPFATGLLVVLVGRATRIQRFVMTAPKAYETLARLGWTSTTGDVEGELTETGRLPDLDRPLPTGLVVQRPPAYSAVHVDGERAYRRARRGETVEVPERTVRVDRFEVLERTGDTARFVIECGSGTYVRSLIADLGDAYCLELRRTAIGPFSVEDADPERLLPLEAALTALLPVRGLGAEDARAAGHGRPIAAQDAADGPLALLADDGPVAIAERRDDGQLWPVVGFRG